MQTDRKIVDAQPTENKRTVKLATDRNPPTADGHVNIGMGLQVFLPSVEAQRSGFVPESLQYGESERKDGTAVLLQQFPGIYVPFKEKG